MLFFIIKEEFIVSNNYKKTEIDDDMIIWRYMPWNFFMDLLKKRRCI